MHDPYYSPEAFGLTKVAEIDYSSGSYEFDIRCVWKHATGLYMARDSGCSCPSPFEKYGGVETLERLDIDELRREGKRHRSGDDYNRRCRSQHDIDVFIREVEDAARGGAS